ncbi:hypothetical protein HMPREF9145_0313 [Segatella salivae F0493]|uniref:Uncharacterized protein n=1 Tax=Segatella salivae F0493 TaxID=1395125 RepID=U2LBT5_9BACT|nr:hypothetical protein HMPREF9145_0313 [Segatella salivae F0493]
MKFLADVNLLAVSCFDASLLNELVENASEILLHCLVNLDVNNLIAPILCFRCDTLHIIDLAEFALQYVFHVIVHGTFAVSHDLDDILYHGISCRTDRNRTGIRLAELVLQYAFHKGVHSAAVCLHTMNQTLYHVIGRCADRYRPGFLTTETMLQHVLHKIVHGTAAVSHDLDDLLYLGISLRTDGHWHGILLVDAIALQKHATVIAHLILLHCLEIFDVNTVVKSNCLFVSCTVR